MTFRAKGSKPLKNFPSALPVTTVATAKDARSLQVFCGCLSYDNKTYRISPMSGFERNNVDSLKKAGVWLDRMYRKLRDRRTKRGQDG